MPLFGESTGIHRLRQAL